MRKKLWFAFVGCLLSGATGCGLFCDRHCERQHDRCDRYYNQNHNGCYAPPAGNCAPAPVGGTTYYAQPQHNNGCYP